MVTIGNNINVLQLEAIANIQSKDLKHHAHNVAILSMELARLCECEEQTVRHIYIGGLLHDIGKQFIPPGILNKNSKFTQEEFEQVKLHPWKGYTYLHNLTSDHIILNTVLYHHERWNGSGYPYGLRSNEIPLGARICAVIDVWDALISDRCYRSALNMIQACDLIWTGAGSLFDPDVVYLFLKLIEDKSAECRSLNFRPASQNDGYGYKKSFVAPKQL